MKKDNSVIQISIVGVVAILGIIIMIVFSGSPGQKSLFSQDVFGHAGVSALSPISTKVSGIQCTDSDGGINYSVKGKVIYQTYNNSNNTKKDIKTYIDYCRNYNSTILVEYYCNKNKVTSTNYNCPQGCVNGACIKVAAVCGNGKIEPGEECDDGNKNNDDKCNTKCKQTWCGDAIIQAPNGKGQMELCDDGNTNNNDTCINNCTLVQNV